MPPYIHKTDPDAYDAPSAIYGFDRFHVWLDHTELPIKISTLERHCTEITVCVEQMPYNARWKLKLVALQPTIKFLQLLVEALGSNIAVLLTYVEIACDIPANGSEQALLWRDNFMAKASMKSQRGTVVLDKHDTTYYFGSRYKVKKQAHKKVKEAAQTLRDNVLAVYADKPSKLNNAQPVDGDLPCLHIENRTSGTAALVAHGIVSLSDLILFNHQRFWDEHLIAYLLPKPTKLGRILVAVNKSNPGISDTAIVKQAHAWKKRYLIEGNFIMHNAIINKRAIAKYFDSHLFTDWIKTLNQ